TVPLLSVSWCAHHHASRVAKLYWPRNGEFQPHAILYSDTRTEFCTQQSAAGSGYRWGDLRVHAHSLGSGRAYMNVVSVLTFSGYRAAVAPAFRSGRACQA